MDTEQHNNIKYTQEKYEYWFRKFLCAQPGTMEYFTAREMVSLLKGQAIEYRVEWSTIQLWESPIRAEVNTHAS